MSKKGFTLVELLVAATIIGILLVFATTQYRQSAGEARWNQAKTHADQLANAVRRAKLDYPNLQFLHGTDNDMNNVTSGSCIYNPFLSTAQNPSTLITCGYLENGPWNEGKFEYYVCKDAGTADAKCKVAGALACVYAKCSARLPSRIKQYVYCVSETGITETTDATRCAS